MAPSDTALPPASSDSSDDRSTHFIFVSKVFQLPGGYFSMARDTGETVFNVHLGDVWGKIPFRTLRESFDIGEKTDDGRLLGIVERSLKFVKEIRPGDSIPREILDGTASWRVDERHLNIARGRITLQLVSWMTGSESTVTDRFQLEQMVEDPSIKQRAQQAFSELAKKFGIPDDRKHEVTDKVDKLARELSYIEALRERFGLVQRIMSQLGRASKLFKTDRELSSEVSRMQALAKTPMANFDDIFIQVDGQTGEILSMLKTYDATVAFIRRMRDELHTSLMVWDEIIDTWDHKEVDKTDPETEFLLKKTYQFLAKHFLISKVWRGR
jgi:hypothetical protein